MSSEDNDFRLLLGRVRAGCEDASQELVETYGGRVRRAVRRVLQPRMRSLFDSVDFVQIVWGSIFAALECLPQFETPAELCAYLVKMAYNQVASAARHQGRSGASGAGHEHASIEDRRQEAEQIPDGGPAPIAVAVAREQLERMLADAPPHWQMAIELRLQGLTQERIAESLEIPRIDVYRFFKRLAEKYAGGMKDEG